MPQKDFILRQIEMLGAALAVIRKMILGAKGDARAQVESRLQSVSQTGGMALDLARAASPETLRMLIAPTGEIEPGRCWLLAETLYLDGLHADQLGDEGRTLDSLGKGTDALFPFETHGGLPGRLPGSVGTHFGNRSAGGGEDRAGGRRRRIVARRLRKEDHG